MKFSPDKKEVSHVMDLSLEEEYLNRQIVESIFRFFLVSVMMFGVGVMASIFLFTRLLSISPEILWTIFFIQIAIFVIIRYLSSDRQFGFIVLSLVSVVSGILLAPILIHFNGEFGFNFANKALLVSCLLFGGCAIIGWSIERFMPKIHGLIKYGCIFMLFFSLIAPFINWTNNSEFIFSTAGILFFAIIILFDFQKIRYYPRRAALSASSHLFINLFILFIFTLRLLSSFQRV